MSRVIKSSEIIIDKDRFELQYNKNNYEENNESPNIEKMLDETKQLGDEIISKAKIEAEDIISNSYERSKSIMEQAKQNGYKEGKQEGFEEGKRLADSIIKEALDIKEEVLKTKLTMTKELEKDVIKLVITTIEKVLNRKIDEDHDFIFGLIDQGLKKCAFTEDLTLRVSPEDYDLVVSSKDKILALSENIHDIVIKQDKSLSKGSCIIDTSSGSIDSSVSTQYNTIKSIFEELLKSE